ncbi:MULTISPECIES: helix-turn-helix domain-containing protein [Liquorilactobacillus]|uniref:helix-turn-helix domain-containing protein n=2 Tax=Liquorilactobacillus TaxID=2767888 RepID=UPI0039E7E4E5
MNKKEKYTLMQWRGIRGMTKQQLAEKSGLTDTTIRKYENDVSSLRQAKYTSLENLAKALGVSVNDIYLSPSSEKPKYAMTI